MTKYYIYGTNTENVFNAERIRFEFHTKLRHPHPIRTNPHPSSGAFRVKEDFDLSFGKVLFKNFRRIRRGPPYGTKRHLLFIGREKTRYFFFLILGATIRERVPFVHHEGKNYRAIFYLLFSVAVQNCENVFRAKVCRK